MTGFVYQAFWEIRDRDRPISALIAEAAGQIDVMAGLAGVKLVGVVQWRVVESRLIGWAAAQRVERPAPRRSLEQHKEQILRLAARNLTDRQIADVVGMSESGVAKVRRRNGMKRRQGWHESAEVRSR